jgi:uncharacterized membrane protein (UPF0127 family)
MLAAVVVLGALAFLIGSGLVFGPEAGSSTRVNGDVVTIVIGGRKFRLEVAADEETRFRGLSGRDNIAPDGGMIFVFPRPTVTAFVMRDCLVPIDIIFLDKSGRITAMHQMQTDPPRAPHEEARSEPYPGAPEWSWVNSAYENRLKKYPSLYAVQFAIELKGGTLPTLGLRVGDKIEFDHEALIARAR